ncbi:MAG: CRTAC1 family protein, partial [Vicinamibacterales bacterium]
PPRRDSMCHHDERRRSRRSPPAPAHRVPRLAIAVAIITSCLLPGGGVPSASEPLFVEGEKAAGLTFTHVNGATGQYYMAEQMGAGVALFDFDNDGDLDVFLIQGGSLGPTSAPPSSSTTSRLFRNDLTVGPDGGRGLHFTDVTDRAGVALRAYGMGAAVGDYDNDGFLDLFITSFGPETLFHNDGDGTFTDVTARAGVSDPLWSASAAFIDYDRDGDLDLFVANYLDFSLAGNKTCHDAVGARDYCSPRAYGPVPDRLYRNDGNGRFTDVSQAAGISTADGPGLGVSTGDYNGDGWLDLYVANDATPNQLWINQHDGTFVDTGLISGAAVNASGNPEGSMGIASGDFDADGDEDLFVTNVVGETFAMYAADGRGTFDDVRTKTGLAAATAAFTGFGTDWLDYDNDGWLDLFVVNGAVNVVEALRGQPRPFRMRNQLFHNSGAGRFDETSAAAGPGFARADVGRGAAFGDIDNDGDVDIIVTNNGGPVRLLLNRGSSTQHWLSIRTAQDPGNRFGFGAMVGIERAGRPTLWRRVRTDGSYLSASDTRVPFGLGPSAAVDAVIIRWPDGAAERWLHIATDRVLVLRKGTGTATP